MNNRRVNQVNILPPRRCQHPESAAHRLPSAECSPSNAKPLSTVIYKSNFITSVSSKKTPFSICYIPCTTEDHSSLPSRPIRHPLQTAIMASAGDVRDMLDLPAEGQPRPHKKQKVVEKRPGRFCAILNPHQMTDNRQRGYHP